MNRLIPLLLLCVMTLAGVMGWLALRKTDTPAASTKSVLDAPALPQGRVDDPQVLGISEAASYAAQLKATTQALESVKQDFNAYRRDDQKRIEQTAQKLLAQALPDLEQKLKQPSATATGTQNAVAPMGTDRVIDASSSDKTIQQARLKTDARLLDSASSGIPPGFGFDDPRPGLREVASPLKKTMGLVAIDESFAPGYVKVSAWRPHLHQDKSIARLQPQIEQPSVQKKAQPRPVYTIENTATLFSNTTLTALMGVVPTRNGALLDPIRFKLITGADNIASNGLSLPDVRDIVWTGYAYGNREMSCVRATVDTVTFTFQDGTIRTVQAKDKGSGKSGRGLGYLSDRWGKPCIKGELITNASQYLKDRMIAASAAAAASASAAAQVASRNDSNGVTTSVTGSRSDYIAGQTGTASLMELAQYLRDRMDQAVDIVYLNAGQEVALHVEEEIAIDYDPNGRRLSHETAALPKAPVRLD